MAIKAQCGSCGAAFKAKDELAGKRVKCPKCAQPLTIPAVRTQSANPAAMGAGIGGAKAHNPLLDLLDEAGVESMPQGPMCDNCGAEMEPTAIVCVECGYNMSTGERISTTVYEEGDGGIDDPGMTDADKIMAKAEQEIDEMPETAVGQDFGDGADSFLIAFGGFIVMMILVSIGVAIIYLMDLLGEAIDPAKISFYASIGIYVLCTVWITIIAFLAKPIQGVICVASGGLYCIIFGFMQGRGLIIPTIILCAAILIGLVSFLFAFRQKERVTVMLDEIPIDWDMIQAASSSLCQLVSIAF